MSHTPTPDDSNETQANWLKAYSVTSMKKTELNLRLREQIDELVAALANEKAWSKQVGDDNANLVDERATLTAALKEIRSLQLVSGLDVAREIARAALAKVGV